MHFCDLHYTCFCAFMFIALKLLSEEIDDIGKNFEVDENVLEVQFWLTGDHNFLVMALGLHHANSKHPCLYCTEERQSFWRWWNVNQASNRTLQEATEEIAGVVFFFSFFLDLISRIADIFAVHSSKKGYARPPILPVHFDHVVPDQLHLLLRIFDKLQHLLQKNELNEDKAKLDAYVDKVQNIVKKPYRYFCKDGSITWSTLDAADRLRVSASLHVFVCVCLHSLICCAILFCQCLFKKK